MFASVRRRVAPLIATSAVLVAALAGVAPAQAATDTSGTVPETPTLEVTEAPEVTEPANVTTEPVDEATGTPSIPSESTTDTGGPGEEATADPFVAEESPAVAATQTEETTVVSPFSDVPSDHSFVHEIVWLAESGITTGWADGTFRPFEPVLRDQVAAFLYRFADSPAWDAVAANSLFRDILPGRVFFREVTWLSASGVTSGWGDGTFRPLEPVRRDQMAAFLYRMAGSPAYSAPAASPFSDVPTTRVFYKEIAWLAEQEVTTGWEDGTFRPVEPVRRDQMAAFLSRFVDQGMGAAVVSTAPASNVVCGSLPRGGCFQVTDSGVTYGSSADRLHHATGAIGAAWSRLGSWDSRLGYPVSAERCGLASGGCVQSFDGGHVYWSSSTGANVMWGGTAITNHWINQGWENGPLGYPTGNETCSGGTCEQSFQNGRIAWNASRGAYDPDAGYTGTPIEIGQAMAADAGWTGAQWTCLHNLWQRESNWNPAAYNRSSGATGIPQALPGSKMASHGDDWRTNPVTQIAWGIDYIKGRYGTACGAWDHSQARGWY